jgi:hypothetical protein
MPAKLPFHALSLTVSGHYKTGTFREEVLGDSVIFANSKGQPLKLKSWAISDFVSGNSCRIPGKRFVFGVFAPLMNRWKGDASQNNCPRILENPLNSHP